MKNLDKLNTKFKQTKILLRQLEKEIYNHPTNIEIRQKALLKKNKQIKLDKKFPRCHVCKKRKAVAEHYSMGDSFKYLCSYKCDYDWHDDIY